MNKSVKFFIYTISIGIILSLIYNSNQKKYKISPLKNISNQKAEKAIENYYLDLNSIDENINYNNTVYAILEICIKENTTPTAPLMIKSGQEFYVFQNNHLIYSQAEGSYYQGVSKQKKEYYQITYNPKKSTFKTLHQIPKHSIGPLYILIKKDVHKDAKDYVEIPKINKKKISSLITTKRPIIKINTHSGPLSKEKYCFSSVSVIPPPSSLGYQLLSKIKIRGNTSATFPKKKLNIIFKEKTALNKLNIQKNVLIGSYNDKSLMRNKLAENLFSLFKKRQSTSEYVHVIINDVYEGLYLLVEHPEKQFKKLIKDTTKLSFLLQIDRGPFDFYGSSDNTGYKIEYANNHNENIQTQLHWFEKTISHLPPNQQWNQEPEGPKINMDSFIDFVILNELSKNIDAYRLSTYLSFADTKFSIDIIWDFDLAWGLADYNEGFNYEGFVIDGEISTFTPKFWNQLWENEVFQEKLKKRYQELRKVILSDSKVEENINSIYKEIMPSVKENFEKWEIIDKDIWPNKFNFQSYNEEVNYLKNWIKNRLNWLDTKWGA